MTDSSREALITHFLEQAGWADAQRSKLAGDASFRRYDRLEGPKGRAVLMDAPPPEEDIRPFVRVARHLTSLGLGAPRILATDAETGFLLLEDLGDAIFTRVLCEGADETVLYSAAIDALALLHKARTPDDIPPYDDDLLLFELSLLTDWFMPLAGLDLSPDGQKEFIRLWEELLPLARAVPDCVVLRDYHADNLLWLPDRSGAASVGQLDFQDAVVGPLAYDIVSLLEDARRDVAPATVPAVIDHYLDQMPDISREAFDTAYAVLGAQRNLKIAGIFCRLLSRDGKAAYQDYMPRVWRHVATDLCHPALEPLSAWLDRWIPPAARTRAA